MDPIFDFTQFFRIVFQKKYRGNPWSISARDGPFSANMSRSIPYFEEMVSMIPLGRMRPNVPDYPLVTENIGEAISQIYNGSNQPNEALQHAATISADELGW